MISEGTHNQLRYTEKYQIKTGIIKDRRVLKTKVVDVHYQIGIHKFDYIEYEDRCVYNDMFIKYTDNEEYWNNMSEITIEQSEFNSLGLNYMHFKDERLKKSNPYIVKKVWIDFGNDERKKPFIGFQQLYHDSVRVKIIAPQDDIEAIRRLKRFEEKEDINDELSRIRSYSGNDYHKKKKVIATSTSGERYEVTTLEDFDFEYEIYDKWTAYGKAMKASNRINYLEEQIARIEEKIFSMDELERDIYGILAHEYEVDIYTIDERYQLAEDSQTLSKKHDVHPAELWKAFYVYILPIIKKEYEWLEKQF